MDFIYQDPYPILKDDTVYKKLTSDYVKVEQLGDREILTVDPATQIKVKNMIKVLSQNAETTFLISSHDLAHTTEVCNRIVVCA